MTIDIDKFDVTQILASVSTNSLDGNKPFGGAGLIWGFDKQSLYSPTVQEDTNNITNNAVDAINNSDYNNSAKLNKQAK